MNETNMIMRQQDKPKWEVAREAIESWDGAECSDNHKLAETMTIRELEEAFYFLQKFYDGEEIDDEGEIGFQMDFLEFCREEFSQEVRDVIEKF